MLHELFKSLGPSSPLICNVLTHKYNYIQLLAEEDQIRFIKEISCNYPSPKLPFTC